MNKVVFLDIDGVLNTPQNAVERRANWRNGTGKSRDEFGQLFCPQAVSNLELLCCDTLAKCVISSTWRRAGLEKMKAMFSHRNIKIDVIDVTPDLVMKGDFGLWKAVIRGREIEEWLKNNPVDRYLILDDDRDMLPEQQPFFVRTNFENGFNHECLIRGIEILNR